MVRKLKRKFMKQAILISCVLCIMLILINTSVFGVNTTYIIRNAVFPYEYENDDPTRNEHYYLYVHTSLASGIYYIFEYPNYINKASSIVLRPYTIWVKYMYERLSSTDDEIPIINMPTLTISSCDSTGEIISGTTTIIPLAGTEEDVTEYIAIKPNEGLLFDLFAGEIYGRYFKDYNFGYMSPIVITYQLDEASPDQPRKPVVQSEIGNVLYKNDRYYASNDAVIAWDRVADNKTEFEGHQIGSDFASVYVVNVNGTDSTWISDTKQTLAGLNIIKEGTYHIKFKARDYDQNESIYSVPITLVIDNSVAQPVVPANSIRVLNQGTKYDITFNWGAVTDAQGVKYQVALSHSSDQPGVSDTIIDVDTNQYIFDNHEYSSEPYYAYVRAVDGVGNTSPWTKSSVFYLTPPSTNITSATSSSELYNGQSYYKVSLALQDVGTKFYVIERQMEGEATPLC